MNQQRGFTIIEVLLFLAISALLLSGVMAGITANVNSTRFLSSNKDLQAYLQKQYDDVQAGLSERPVNATCPYGSQQAPGASDNCIVIGKLVSVEDKLMRVYPVVAYGKPQAVCPNGQTPVGSDQAAQIFQYCPVALGTDSGVTVDNYQYLWGIQMTKTQAKLASGGNQSFYALAVLKSPVSGGIFTFSLINGPHAANSSYKLTANDLTKNNANQDAVICIESPDVLTRKAHVSLLGGYGATVIKTGDGSVGLPGGLTC